MSEKEINETIKNTLSLVFEVSEDEITEDTSADSVENWDSIRHLNLILALEEQFDITIPDEDVGNMLNFKIISHVVVEALNGK